MKSAAVRRGTFDADTRAVRRAAREVGVQITVWSSALVVAVLISAFAFVFENVSPSFWRDFGHHHATTIDVGAIDILIGGSLIGLVAIALAGTISVMATRRAVKPLATALRTQRTFVADASHELRTPLAVLDARLQMLQRSLDADDRSASIVADLRRDTKGLINIVNELLAAAELNQSANPSKEPVDVAAGVAEAVDSMRPIADREGVRVTVSSSVPATAYLSTGALTRSVVAVLDNALRYSTRGSEVQISVSIDGANVLIAVRDQGSGIQGVDPSRIFDRFVRSSIAPTEGGPTRSGFGIGLSLVRDSVESVGGRAFVSSTSHSGTEITLVLPAANT
jgi:two-component system, OmpR family, sensor kinase